jgi:hypothetical protein
LKVKSSKSGEREDNAEAAESAENAEEEGKDWGGPSEGLREGSSRLRKNEDRNPTAEALRAQRFGEEVGKSGELTSSMSDPWRLSGNLKVWPKRTPAVESREG